MNTALYPKVKKRKAKTEAQLFAVSKPKKLPKKYRASNVRESTTDADYYGTEIHKLSCIIDRTTMKVGVVMRIANSTVQYLARDEATPRYAAAAHVVVVPRVVFTDEKIDLETTLAQQELLQGAYRD